MYRNAEGYSDPTAGRAFARIEREEKKAEAARRGATELIPTKDDKAKRKKKRKQWPKIGVMRW